MLLAGAFRRFGDSPVDVVGLLTRAVLEDPSALVRREAVYQVAALGRDVSAPILQKAMSDPDATVARAARLRADTEAE